LPLGLYFIASVKAIIYHVEKTFHCLVQKTINWYLVSQMDHLGNTVV